MRRQRLDAMTRGWFVGDFAPSVLRTGAAEVGVKRYAAGDTEGWHFHKIATEITLILSGEVEMCGQRFGPGDIVTLEPGEGTSFRAITDAVNVVVKVPGATHDKYTEPPAG
jgi:quercetin dioxygenase-like cupin family protein